MPALTCFYVSASFLVIFANSFILMAAIAIDRFISVIWPIQYKFLNKKIYFSIVFVVCLINSVILLYLAHDDAKTDRTVTCGITSTLYQNASFFMGMALFCEFLSVLIYAILWIVMRFTVNENVATTKRIFKSLLCILLLSLFGFTPNTSYYLVAKILRIPNFWIPTTRTVQLVMQATIHLALIASVANTIILFKFSWEYRRAFLRYIPMLCYIFKYTEPGHGHHNPNIHPNLQIVASRPALTAAAPSPGRGTSQISPVETIQQNPLNRHQPSAFTKRNSHPQYFVTAVNTTDANNTNGSGARRSTVFHY